MTKNRTLPLVECAIMIALATVLSMVKLAELPYGCLLYTSRCV